jgi:transposase-like protein
MNKASSTARERWRRIVKQQRSSGLSVARFCREQGLADSSLFAWKRRLAREAEEAAAPTFFAVTPAAPRDERLPSDPSNGGIELHLGGGRHILLRPGFDGPTLAAALAVLEEGR